MKNRLSSFKPILTKRYLKISRKFIVYKRKTLGYIDRKPLQSFFIVLGIVLALIIISNLLPKPKPSTTEQQVAKKVDIYRIGTAPKITVQAQIKKSGVIQITAQTAGVVNFIHVFEGDKVSKGSPLVNLASNYYGGNAASLQRQIAQQQMISAQSTYQTQKELIQKQKDIALKTDDNSNQLRDITAKSNDETSALISLNEQILKTIDEDLATLQLSPVTNRSLILSTQQLKSQFLASTNQARSALRSSQYQSAADKPSAQLADLTREITVKQLEIQEKQLDINKEISRLQFLLAQVNEATFFPAAPFAGIVERVFVKPFETVSPGSPLMILSQTIEDDPITAVAFVSKDIANRASKIEESILHIGDKTISAAPSFISTEAVQGSLYAIYYPIPEAVNKDLTNDGFISVDIPVGYPDSSAIAAFVPLDAIYQTRTSAYLFVVDGDKAKSKEVKLGQVYGRFVEVQSGLAGSEAVILNRNVIEGDKIE